MTPIVRVKLGVSPASITSANVRAVSRDGALPALTQRLVTFSSGTSVVEEFTMSIPLPAVVTNIEDAWQWEISDLNGSDSVEILAERSGDHSIFIVLKMPNDPVTKPWEQVLDVICAVGWCSGESSVIDAMNAITMKLFDTLEYQSEPDRYTSFVKTLGLPTGEEFKLQDFLDDSFSKAVTCYDISNVSIIFGNSLGADYSFRRKENLDTHKIVACGPGGFVGWYDADFDVHQFVEDSTIWDPCVAVDVDGDPENYPYTGSYVTNMNMTDYESVLVNDWDNPLTLQTGKPDIIE